MVKGELDWNFWIHIHCLKFQEHCVSNISVYLFDPLFDGKYGQIPAMLVVYHANREISKRFFQWNTDSKSLTSGTLLAISGAHLRTGDLDATWCGNGWTITLEMGGLNMDF